jgi:hypothetical protein
MSPGVSIKRNELVPDPFQNIERIRGDEDMANRALKKCADHVIAVIEASISFQILYAASRHKNHHQMRSQPYRNLSASGVHESASI